MKLYFLHNSDCQWDIGGIRNFPSRIDSWSFLTLLMFLDIERQWIKLKMSSGVVASDDKKTAFNLCLKDIHIDRHVIGKGFLILCKQGRLLLHNLALKRLLPLRKSVGHVLLWDDSLFGSFMPPPRFIIMRNYCLLFLPNRP